MIPDINAIEERAEKATPGPWKIIDKGNTVRSFAVVSESYVGIPQQMICPNMSPKTSNAEFIAHARTDIPALLAYIKELEDNANMYITELNSRIEQLTAEEKRLDRLFRGEHDIANALQEKADRLEVENERLREENRWISTEKRLPDNCEVVLAFSPFECGVLMARYSTKRNQWEEWGIDDFDSMAWLRINGVTHWRPLPAPPTEV